MRSESDWIGDRKMDNEKVKRWLETHDGEDYCHYCIHDSACPHGMACYGDMPIEPPCTSQDMEDFMDLEWLLEDIENGEWEMKD